jgi:hypothetical protein
MVDDVIQEESQDRQRIEHLLDGILGFCFDEKMLGVYKRFCRYYYGIDPKATAEYVFAYRDMWENEQDNAARI